MHFGLTDVILLHCGHQHVLVTNVAIFRVARTSDDIVCAVNCLSSSLYILYRRSPTWITIHHMYLLCTSPHIPHTTTCNF
jgi:hypothetical protein